MATIDRDEFRDAVHLIRDDIAGVHTRLDALNGRTRANELEIVRLQERQRRQTKKGAAWLGSLSVVLAGLAEGLRWVLTK